MKPDRPSLRARMAYAICDADISLEDMKHRYRCDQGGCLVGRGLCIAFKQAKAALKVVEAEEAVSGEAPASTVGCLSVDAQRVSRAA
jgi:hypothetical protein